jgi:D-alanine transaminase
MLRQGYVTEGSSNNVWIIRSKNIMTRQSDNLILSGITRAVVLECAKKLNYEVITKNFTKVDAESADEAFMTSATGLITPVVKINSSQIGDGKPGNFTKSLRAEYIKRALEIAI